VKRDGKKPAVFLQSAEESALRLLARRDYSREEMRRKLTGKGFPSGEIDDTLRKLEIKKILDDFRYARHLAIAFVKEKFLGPQQMSQIFFQKGIPADLAKAAMAIADATLPVNERVKHIMRMKLKGRLLEELAPNEKRKLVDTLRRKGFLWEDIQEAIQETGGFTDE
jgi:regulatory protein